MAEIAGFYVARGEVLISGPHQTRQEAEDVAELTGDDDIIEVAGEAETFATAAKTTETYALCGSFVAAKEEVKEVEQRDE